MRVRAEDQSAEAGVRSKMIFRGCGSATKAISAWCGRATAVGNIEVLAGCVSADRHPLHGVRAATGADTGWNDDPRAVDELCVGRNSSGGNDNQ